MAKYRFVRGNNDQAIDLIKDHLIPDSDAENNEVFIQQFKQGITQYPENVYLQLVFDQSNVNNPVLVAFLAAFAPIGSWRHVVISQTWADGKHSGVVDQLFFRTIIWAQSLGRSQIRMETARDPAAMTRKWHFEPISTTMQFDVSEDWQEKLFEKITHSNLMEATDGKVKRTEDSQQSHGRPEANSEASSGLHQPDDRPDSDAVSGTDRAEPDATVSESAPGDQPVQSGDESVPDGTEPGTDYSPVRDTVLYVKP